MNSMDAKSRALLEKDPANPNAAPGKPAPASHTRTVRSTVHAGRPPLKARSATPSGRTTPSSRPNPNSASGPVRPGSGRSTARPATHGQENSSKSPDAAPSGPEHNDASGRSAVAASTAVVSETDIKSSGNKSVKQPTLSSAPVRPKIKRVEQPRVGTTNEHSRPREVPRVNQLPLEPAGAAAMNTRPAPVKPRSPPLKLAMPSKKDAKFVEVTPKSSPKSENLSHSEAANVPSTPGTVNSTLSKSSAVAVSPPSSPTASSEGYFHSKIPISPRMAAERRMSIKSRESSPKSLWGNGSVGSAAEMIAKADRKSPPRKPSPIDSEKANLTKEFSGLALGSPLELPSSVAPQALQHSNENNSTSVDLSGSEQACRMYQSKSSVGDSLTSSYVQVMPEQVPKPSSEEGLEQKDVEENFETTAGGVEIPQQVDYLTSADADSQQKGEGIMQITDDAGDHQESRPSAEIIQPVPAQSTEAIREEEPLSTGPNASTSQQALEPPLETYVSGKATSGRLPDAQVVVIHDVAHRWGKIEAAAERRAVEPRSKDSQYCRQMLEKGIASVRNHAIDVVGYRHLQGLIMVNEKVFDEEPLYDQLLLTLFHDLARVPEERPEKENPVGRPYEMKTQVLLTIGFMFRYGQRYFKRYFAYAIATMVKARGNFEDRAHIVGGLLKATGDITAKCTDPEEIVDTVLDFVEGELRNDEHNEEVAKRINRSMLMALQALRYLLFRFKALKIQAPPRLIERVGSFAGKRLNDEQANVRQAATDLCIQIYLTIGADKQRLFSVLGHLRETSKNLLTYYIARQG